MFIIILGSSIGLVFIVGSCMLVKKYIDLNVEIGDTPLSGGSITAAGVALLVDGVIVIEILRTWNIIGVPGLVTLWVASITVLTYLTLYIYWISYLIKEGDIKEPLVIVVVVFVGLVLLWVVTGVFYFTQMIMSPDNVLRLLSEYLNMEV